MKFLRFDGEHLLFLFALFGFVQSRNLSDPICLLPCNCTKEFGGQAITAHCSDIQRVEDLAKYILLSRNVTTLVVTKANLYTIPPLAFVGFSALVNLTLSGSSITVITNDAFQGLNALQNLDLGKNKIKFWEGDGVSSQLSSLQTIDLSFNPPWTPTDAVLRIHSLKEIRGLTWSEPCSDCSLVKKKDKNATMRYSKGHYSKYIVWHCRGTEYTVSKETQKFARHGFYPECFSTNRKCYESQVTGTKSHRCWSTDNMILYLEYFISILSIVLNVTVVTVTLTSRLKYNIAMLLVSNLAFSDLLNGVYSISITIARQTSSYIGFLTYFHDLCSVLGFLWVLGQFGTIQTSVLLTIERYMTIIFSMKPRLKPTPFSALSCICITWLVAIAAAVLPLVGLGSYVTNTYCVPMQPSKLVPSSFMYSVSLSVIGVVLYFLTIPLYVRIFAFVRHSSHQVGVKRDAKIAGRILILVLTNMVFFLTPIILALLWLLTDIFKKDITVEARNVLVGVFPTLCFSLNAFLNPLLYAFRNARFKQALRFRLSRLVTKTNAAVGDISMKSRSAISQT